MKTSKSPKENRKADLYTTLKTIASLPYSLKIGDDFYPALDFIKSNTSINNINDRDYYLYILLNFKPATAADINCENYLYESLINFDSKYYKDLNSEIQSFTSKEM